MATARYAGRQFSIKNKKRVQTEAGPSGGDQSEQDQAEVGQMERGERVTKFCSQEANSPKGAGDQMSCLYREEPQGQGQPSP